ncbi:MAG: MarR family transcriptional regulator [Clostridia bacterium]|nr:MarR family transcriptional regulator [Clostridia bacterium]
MESGKYLNKLILTIKFLEGLNMLPENVNLSQTEFRLIREIVMEREAGNQIISSEIARRLNITRSAVSQLVTKLEKKGVVNRMASPTDRKIFYVVLSESSLAIFKQQCDEVNRLINRVVEEFGHDKTDRLIELCEDFATVFDRLRKESDHEQKSLHK